MVRDNWDWENIKGEPLGGWSGQGRNLPPSRFSRRMLWQGLIAGLLLLAITVVFRLDSPFAKPIQTGLRYYLTAPSADYTMAVAETIRTGLWLDSYDRWVFHSLMPEEHGVVPVINEVEQSEMMLPLSGKIYRPYGWMIGPDNQKYFHYGIDIQSLNGTEVHAALTGKVIRVGKDPILGNVIEIDHGKGLITVYGTLEHFKVKRGQTVEKGEIIGNIGNTEGPLLHFEIRKNGQAVDPTDYLNLPSKI